MSDAMSFAELDGQHVELLAARTVLSMFSAAADAATSPGGFGPDQFARGVVDFLMAGSSIPGADGSSNGGGNGADNS